MPRDRDMSEGPCRIPEKKTGGSLARRDNHEKVLRWPWARN